MPTCRASLMALVIFALSIPAFTLGNTRAARIAMILITASSSMSVKAAGDAFVFIGDRAGGRNRQLPVILPHAHYRHVTKPFAFGSFAPCDAAPEIYNRPSR